MKARLSIMMFLFTVFIGLQSYAQERTVKGTVTDDSGMPVPGVSVLVKGTNTGVETDFDGKFAIKALANQTLVFSMIGMKKQELLASSTSMNVKMKEDAQELEGVVVTALGIKREKQALGYATSEVKAKDIEQRSEGDVARILSGKASGVTINNTSGISGSGTNIQIRTINTVSGSSQPLFIIDGVPFSSDTNAKGNFENGNSGSSRFLDIDPNNIESVNVLKGYAAATLYGTQGKNGVILITTKAGSKKTGPKKTEISISQSLFFNQIASLPDYQNTFGNGFDQAYGNFFSNWGPGFYKDGLGGYAAPGSNVAIDGTILHPYSRANLATVLPQYSGQRIKYEARPDNVKDFFRTGIVSTTNLNIGGTSDDGKNRYNFSFGHLEDEGFTPGNKVNRFNISMGGSSKLTNKFTVSGTMNFSRTDFVSPPVASSTGSGTSGTGLSIFADIFYTPRNVDLQNWPYQNPVTGANLSYRSGNDILNPYWTLNNSFFKQLTNRVFGNAALEYEINKNLNVIYRVGYDFYNERNENGTNRGAPRGPVLGEYETYDNNNLIMDHNFMVTGNYELTKKIGLNFNVGATSRHENYDRQGVRSTDQTIFNVFRHFNFTNQTYRQLTEKRNIIGLYAQVDFDYDKYLYLSLAARKDWVSNTMFNNIVYPSASLSYIPTKNLAFLSNNKTLSYLKLRTGYGTSAGFADEYPVANPLEGEPRTFVGSSGVVSSQTAVSRLGNPKLKPELHEEYEFGFESKWWNNRISLDFSRYYRTTTDLITEAPISNSTGFETSFLNIGKLKADGYEIDLGFHLIKNEDKGFNWNMNSNFSKSKNIVENLGDSGLNNITIAGYPNLGNQAIVGEQLGVIVGSRVQRDANGNLMVLSNGNYGVEEGNFIIGNPNPDFIVSNTNSFSYRNFNFSFMINYIHGGDIYSETIGTLLGRGLTTDTVDRLHTYVLPGVKPNGQPNDIQINNSSYYFDNLFAGPDELKVYDGTVIRLQEVSFGYSLPTKFLDKTPFGSLTFTLSGNNLYYKALNTPEGVNFDPNIIGTGVGNGRGIDFLNGPSGRRFGFSVKLTF